MEFSGDSILITVSLVALLVWAALNIFMLPAKLSLIKKFWKLATLFFLVLTVAEPGIRYSEREAGTISVLLDISESMDEEVGDDILEELRNFTENPLRTLVYPFGGEVSGFPVPLNKIDSYRGLRNSWEMLNIGKSNFEKGFERLLLGGSGNVILLSDGYENAGKVRRILPELIESKLKIYSLLPKDIERQGRQQFRVLKVHAPVIAPAGRNTDLRVSLINDFSEQRQGTVSIYQGEKLITEKKLSVAPGKTIIEIFETNPVKEGVQEFRVVLKPESGSGATAEQVSNSSSVFISGISGEKIFLVSSTKEEEKFLSGLLRKSAYKLDSIIAGVDEFGIRDPSRYSVVILNNVAHKKLPRSFSSLLEPYVKGGGSLLMLGGNESFGLGGYKGTPVEDVLPVDPLIPRKEKKRLNVAVELVLDKSGSMKKQNKMAFLQRSADGVIRALKDEDYLGMILFDNSPWELVPMQQLKYNRRQALEKLKLIFPTGQTVLLPAMDLARKRLEAAKAGRKHMIILTDGQVPDANNNRPYYESLVKDMRLMGITVSTFMLGSEPDSILQDLAELGGGAFHRTRDPRTLPRLFLSDLKVVSGERTQKEGRSYDVRKGMTNPVSTEIRTFPPVLGYVQTQRKEKANLELVAYAGGKADPLLTSWRYGEGRSTAFTSDVSGRWSYHWIRWPRFYQFWNDIIDSLRDSSGDEFSENAIDLKYFVENDELVIDLHVFSEKLAEGIKAEITLPDKSVKPLVFQAVSKGSFQGRVLPAQAGTYFLNLSAGRRKLDTVAVYVSGEYSGEKKGRGINRKFLSSLAFKTGGKLNPDYKDFVENERVKEKKFDLTFLAAALALICFLLSLMQREGVSLKEVFRVLKTGILRVRNG